MSTSIPISLSEMPFSDPTQIFRFRDRQFAAELIAVAVLEMHLFDYIKKQGSISLSEVCAHYGFAQRPVDVMMTLCRASGFLMLQDDDRNALTPIASEYWTTDSPWYLGPYYEPYRNSEAYDGFLKVLRSGKPANWGAKRDGDDWHEAMQQSTFAKTFTEIMNCRGKVLGQHLAEKTASLLSSKRMLLDVGGGSGIYALTLLSRNPQMAGCVLEKNPVDAIAAANIKSFGFDDRLKVLSADMFDGAWPHCDVVLLSNVLHDWGIQEVEILLRKGVQCLSSGGVLLIHEAFLSDRKDGPPPVAEYSAMLMHITQGRCYAPFEYGDLLKELGCEVFPYQDTVADRGYLAAIKR